MVYRPLGRSFLRAAAADDTTTAVRGNLYRVIHRILVRGLAPVPPRTTKRNFPISRRAVQ